MEKTMKEMAIERVRNGAPYSEVATELNKSRHIIKKWCKDAGVRTRWCQTSQKEKDAIERNIRKNNVVERVRRGASYTEAANEFGISDYTVASWCKENDVISCALKNKKMPESKKDIAVECVRRGASYKEAADEFDVPKYMITLWCKEKGVESSHAAFAFKKKEKNIAIECVRRGDSYTQVAGKLNASFNTIVSWCKDAGVRSLHAPKNEKAPEAKKDMAVECVRRGASYKETASEFDVALSTIQSWCEQKGVKSPYSHE